MEYENAWLTYRKGQCADNAKFFSFVVVRDENMLTQTAVKELKQAAREIYQLDLKEVPKAPEGIVLEVNAQTGGGEEGYEIIQEGRQVMIRSAGSQGLLYGSFALIRQIQMDCPVKGMHLAERPSNPLRMLNHWDNIDGSIERGYSGKSFFFREQEVETGGRVKAYARLAASVGINGVVINNVNVKGNATRLIGRTYRARLRKMSEIFAAYGIKLYLSLNFAAPMELGGLESADPLDERVKCWWKDTMADVFGGIPNLGGFLVKADSEGRPGPFAYGRTQADGANTLAAAAAPYGGRIIWRCFVYNCRQDWRDRKTDRAKSGYDYFKSLDGLFLDNVILQIKNGPMDFQVREPVSPLFGGLEQTNQMLEVQLAQEYTGQQRHVCYLIPMLKEVLNFHTYCREPEQGRAMDRVADLVSGRTYGHRNCGMAAVANTGDDRNWTGHDLAAANLYGFGRLSFCTGLTAEEIAKEWIAATFGTDETVMAHVLQILLMSWPAYEKYTSPLGIGWMVNPNHHYGPNVDGYEYDRWGTYHRADHLGIGVDRSSRGTGYAGQYRPPNASRYETVETCPEELLLFFHHVPYSYVLKSGKTLIQHIYDSHFDGAGEVKTMQKLWNDLDGKVPPEVFSRVKARLEHQVEHSREWRDQINTYFYRKTMIPDEHGRIIY